MALKKLGDDHLSEQRKAFLDEYVRLGGRHGDGRRAARAASYSESCAAAEACKILKMPAARRYIIAACEELIADGGILGLNVLRELASGVDLCGEKVDHAVQLKASLRLTELSGFQVIAKSEQKVVVKDERNPEERRARIKELQDQGIGKIIELVPRDITPATDEVVSELDEMFGDLSNA